MEAFFHRLLVEKNPTELFNKKIPVPYWSNFTKNMYAWIVKNINNIQSNEISSVLIKIKKSYSSYFHNQFFILQRLKKAGI